MRPGLVLQDKGCETGGESVPAWPGIMGRASTLSLSPVPAEPLGAEGCAHTRE